MGMSDSPAEIVKTAPRARRVGDAGAHRDFQLRRRPGSGTEVLMDFDGRARRAARCSPCRRGDADPARPRHGRRERGDGLGLAGRAVVRRPRPGGADGGGHRALLARSLLRRLPDHDTLAAHADRAAAGERITARLTASDRQLSLSLGPFRRGSGGLLDARTPSPLSMLTDELTVSSAAPATRSRLSCSTAAERSAARRPRRAEADVRRAGIVSRTLVIWSRDLHGCGTPVRATGNACMVENAFVEAVSPDVPVEFVGRPELRRLSVAGQSGRCPCSAGSLLPEVRCQRRPRADPERGAAIAL